MEKFTTVINEIKQLENQISSDSIKNLIHLIEQSNHIFLTGAGRSGLQVNAFANRLMHLGYSVSVVGEISSPHSQHNDLMIISSGSGETPRLIKQATLVKANKVNIVVITTNSTSTLAKLADCIVVIPVSTVKSIQPMGSLYEQSSLLLFDSIVLSLMIEKNETSQSMQARHADIE